MLRHLLEHDAHAEGTEAPSAVFFRRAEAPETGRLRLRRKAAVVLLGNLGRVGVEPCLEGKNLVAHEAAHLLAQEQKLIGKLEPGEEVHNQQSKVVKTTSGKWRQA